MAFNDFIDNFFGLPVLDFGDDADWEGPGHAYRLRLEYDSQLSISKLLEMLLQQDQASALQAIIIGSWLDAEESRGSKAAIASLCGAASRLPALRALFFGEIIAEDCEISWIKHGNVSPLLEAYLKLEVLRIRGASGLSFAPITHPTLREFAVESGGMKRSLLREIFLCQFPALERLELFLGEENYGFDGGVEDLQPVLSGKLYPKLKHLGLMNSTIANDIAALVVNSPIIHQLETLDLSLGVLDDEGVKSLHGLAEARTLKKLNLTHHYASQAAVAALKAALPCEVDASEAQSPDDEWRSIVHAE
jgi:hypothetical protein